MSQSTLPLNRDGSNEWTNLVGDLEHKDPGNSGALVTAALLERQGPSQARKKQLCKARIDKSESAVDKDSGLNP